MAKVDPRAIELAHRDRSYDLREIPWIGADEVSRTGGRVHFTTWTS